LEKAQAKHHRHCQWLSNTYQRIIQGFGHLPMHDMLCIIKHITVCENCSGTKSNSSKTKAGQNIDLAPAMY
jgi:hypothetical protein